MTQGRYTDPVEIANVRLFREGIKAVENRAAPEAAVVVVEGLAGLGKTHTGLGYALQNDLPFVRIQAATTPHWVLTDWVTELKEKPAHSCETLHNQLVQLLAKNPRPVIFDEIEHAVTIAKVIDSIRGVIDAVECPVVFMGREFVGQKLKRHSAVWSRVSNVVRFRPLDKTDMALLLKDRAKLSADDALIDRMIRDTEGRIRLALGAVAEIERFARRAGKKAVTAAELAGRELVKADSARASASQRRAGGDGVMLSLQAVLDALPPPPAPDGTRHVKLDDLAAILRAPKNAVRRRLYRLIDQRYVRSARPGVYALAPKGIALKKAGAKVPAAPAVRKIRGTRPPRLFPQTISDRAWGALRKLRKATTADLASVVVRSGQDGGPAIRSALAAWERYGLVARRGRRAALWIMIRDVGPKAPRRADRGAKLWDPNVGAYLERAA
ncbi:MAG: hypothetical protein NBV67_00930 [Tagaea sp.]|nr:hypothetical protein [Tagaea sp.]